jgi:hypothetical protein
MVEERGKAVRACSGPRLRRGTSLVTTAQVLKAGFVFLSQVVGGGGVLCRVVCVCSLFEGLLCRGVRFGELCINCYFFLNDIAVLLLLFKRTSEISRLSDAKSFRGAHRVRVCIRVFIGVSVCGCCEHLCYTV